MRRKVAAWTLAFILALLLLGSVVLATPTPPYLIVNHSTKECVESILGDDCSWCDPPQGWEVLGYSASNQCPDGYTWVDRIDLQCRGYKNPFCCFSGGAHRGDCEDMIVHEADGLCAFVDDIQNCTLPKGWIARPADMALYSWGCPHDYHWVDPVACVSPESRTGSPLRTGTALAMGCLLFVFIAVVAVGLILVFVVLRRDRQ